MSPVECSKTRTRIQYFIKYALNSQGLMAAGYFSEDDVKCGMGKPWLDMEGEFEIRSKM